MKKIERLRQKICSYSNLNHLINEWNENNEKVVFTNGCFDLIHQGHIDYLAKAADLGDRLIIGLNTDNSVKRLKGENRPIKDEYSRAFILAAMSFVDAVVLFDEDTPYELIKQVQPDILVKGADYKPEDIVGYDIVMEKGGKIKTLDFLPGFSTSLIESKIKNS
ncbi:MAG: D-glycero-beta-D-manno-heptose 1-phosphate adenylyltransferase [Hyphomicrobiales bacterium]